MSEPILEREPTDPKAKHVNPGLKFVLEMGPLLIFFFATLRGEWLIATFPVLAGLGKPLLRRHRAVHGGDGRIRWRSPGCSPARSADATGLGRGRAGVRLAVDLAAERHVHQDEADHHLRAVCRGLLGGLAFGRSLLGYVLDLAFQLDAEGWRKLTFVGALLRVLRGAERGGLAPLIG